ncbi:MAG TPA: hypothetical protein VMU54_25330 [Planctomycetota bacterium]|nr:hypothetical protein [Planctomycetota bacterium]
MKGTKMGNLLERLQPDEAKTVLHRLLKEEPRLHAKAVAIAQELFSDIESEEVAFGIERDLESLDIDDLNDRTGEHGGGYVDPGEAAWVLIREAAEPFLADLNRRRELGRGKEAVEICKGIVLGLYRAKKNDATSWAPDAPLEIAMEAVKALGRLHLPPGFAVKCAPEWAADLEGRRVE